MDITALPGREKEERRVVNTESRILSIRNVGGRGGEEEGWLMMS